MSATFGIAASFAGRSSLISRKGGDQTERDHAELVQAIKRGRV